MTATLAAVRRHLVALSIACTCSLAACGGGGADATNSPGGSLLLTGAVTTAASVHTITFSGYEWQVKDSRSHLVGPGPNVFSADSNSVFVDDLGQLHLVLRNVNGIWRGAEVYLSHSLGYGTYEFQLASSTYPLDPRVVMGLFTWSDATAFNHREIDIEFSRWGQPEPALGGQFVVQPGTSAGNTFEFRPSTSTVSTHSFVWAPGSVAFAGQTAAEGTYSEWTRVDAGVPAPLDEGVHLNLWLDHGLPPFDPTLQQVEMVVSAFRFHS